MATKKKKKKKGPSGPLAQYAPGGGSQDPFLGATGMAKGQPLTAVQVGALMAANGWPRNVDTIARGIATTKGESGWNPLALNESSGAEGLWQILPSAHPDVSHACRIDPSCSTKEAHKIYRDAGGWGPWSFSPSSAEIESFKPEARQGIELAKSQGFQAGAGGGLNLPGLPDLPNPLDGLDAIAKVVESIAKFFVGLGELILTPEGWLMLGKLLGGSLLVVAGVNRLAKQTLGVDPIGGVAHVATGAVAGAIVGGPGGAAIGAVSSGLMGGQAAKATNKIAGAASAAA